MQPASSRDTRFATALRSGFAGLGPDTEPIFEDLRALGFEPELLRGRRYRLLEAVL